MKNVTANVKVRQFSFVHYGNLSDGCLLVIVVVTLIYNFILLLHFSSYSTVEVFPLQMEGVRVVVNKGLSNNFQVTHTVTLSMMGESGYRFGTSYVGRKQIDQPNRGIHNVEPLKLSTFPKTCVVKVCLLLYSAVFPCHGWRYGQYWQPECSGYSPAHIRCALQNSHSGKRYTFFLTVRSDGHFVIVSMFCVADSAT